MAEHQFEERVQGLTELTALPAGPELSAALHDLDPATLGAHDLPVALAAARRQLSADTARFATLAHELGLADIGEPGQRAETLDEYAADEVRAVLAISRTAAWTLLHRAHDTRHRLPQLGDAWTDGIIDEDRVRTFCTWTQALSDQHARRVVQVVLPDAPRMTQRALITRIREVATALDPEWARKLYENSVRQRRLRARMTEQGTGNLSGLDLPLDDVARSVAHITLLAAKAKALGHPGLIDTVRADVFLALLSPELAGADDDTLIAAVLARAHPDDPTDRQVPDPDQAPPDDPGPGDEPGPENPDPPERPGSPGGGGRDRAGTQAAPQAGDDLEADADPIGAHADAEPELEAEAAAEEAVAEEAVAEAEKAAEEGLDEARDADEAAEVAFEPEQTRRRQGPRQARLELRVGLATLLELDDQPARLQGWGVVHAELARLIARDHTAGEWRVAVADHTGALSAALVTRRRPHGYRTTPTKPAGQDPGTGERYVARPVVELHATEAFLDALDPAAYPAWTRVIADLQQQHALWRAARALSAADIADDPAAWREALARFPTAALARWIEMRDRGCVFPTCGASAIACDLDHTLAYIAAGGLTVHTNLDPLCGHDHHAKHDGGWHLAQPCPGCFTWTSPTGHTYTRDPQSPLPELPEPRPPSDGQRSNTEPTDYADSHHGPVWDNEPYPEPPPEPPTSEPPPASTPDNDDPPF